MQEGFSCADNRTMQKALKGAKHTDKEIEEIRDRLCGIAEIAISNYLSKKEDENNNQNGASRK